MKDLTKYFIDLSKLSGDKLKSLVPILENAGYHVYFEDRMFLKHGNYHKPYFHLLNNKSWMSSLFLVMKTELTYPEFIKLFEGGEGENGGWIKIESEADLPPYNKWVIAHTKDGGNHIAYFDKRRSEWVANSKFGDEITHWRHQPEPPKF